MAVSLGNTRRDRVFAYLLPAPASFDLCLQRETEESADSHYRSKEPDAFKWQDKQGACWLAKEASMPAMYAPRDFCHQA